MLRELLKNNLTILAILCAVYLGDPAVQAEVVHPPRVYTTSGPNRYNNSAPKKKHWWQRKETPKSRAKQRAKTQKKLRQAHAAKIPYDPMWNDPVPKSR